MIIIIFLFLFIIVILVNRPTNQSTPSSMINVNCQYSEPPDALIKQDWEKDPWEFPRLVSQSAFDKVDRYLTPLLIRHHLKFFGILGEGCFGQVGWSQSISVIADDEVAQCTPPNSDENQVFAKIDLLNN